MVFIIAFFGATLSYSYPLVEYIGFNTGGLGYSFFSWSSFPLILAVFIAANDYILKPRRYDYIFKTFFVLSVFSFILPFIPFETVDYSTYLRMFVAIQINFAALYGFIKTRNVSYLLFIFAIMSLSIGGMTLLRNENNIGIFANVIGLIFLGLIFFIPGREKHGVSSYFRLKDRLRETKRVLDETKETFEVLFNEMVDAVAIVDRKGKILEASEKFFNILNVDREDVVGKNFLSLPYFDGKTKKKLLKNVALRLAGKKISPYEVEVIKKDGSTIPFEIHAGRVHYKGKIADMAVFRDLTERKKAERALRESEEKYHSMFETTGTATAIFADDRVITRCNSAFEELSGFSKEEIEGKMCWDDFIPEKDRERMMEYHRQRSLGIGNPPSEYDCGFFNKQGELKTVHVKISMVPNSKDRVFSLLDITKRIEAEEKIRESEKRYRTAFKNTGTAMALYDKDGFITMINSEFEKLSGYTEEEILNKMHWNDFVTDDYREKMMYYHNNRGRKDVDDIPDEYDFDIIDKKGNKKNVRVNIGLIPDTNKRIASIIDVTHLKEMQKKLRDMNKNLEEKVKDRTVKINNLLKQKDDFINQLGHDLKNPLGPVMNLLPLLDKEDISGEEKEEMMKVIQRNVDYMKNLVEKTLDLARLNSRNSVFSFEKVRIRDLLNEVISNNSFLLDKKDIDVKILSKPDSFLYVDHLHMIELFNNLLNNAVKYSPVGGRVWIDVERKEDCFLFSVRDEGQGMTEKQVRHVFDEFYKADQSRHDFDNSGLGTTICRRIVEKHGGKIWAESPGLDKGSVFYFTIPLKEKEGDMNRFNENVSSLYEDVIEELDSFLYKD